MIKNGKPKTVASAFESIRADYDMSRVSRFNRRRTGVAAQGGGADYHYRSEPKYYNDMEQARDMDRNDAIVGQTIDRAVANIVQDGFRLDPKTGDSGLDRELWYRWEEFSEDPDACDIAGEFTWHDYESRGMRSMLLDGDCAVLGLVDGPLQFIEAHTIQTSTQKPNTFCGVTMNDFRKRMQFWIMRDGITPNESKESAEPVDVRDEDGYRQIFHVYNPRRANQTRGVTALAPIFTMCGMFEDINFAKLVQQQVVSCFAIFRKKNGSGNTGSPPTTTSNYGSSSTETTSSGGVRQLEGISPGMEIIGADGEELQGFSPNVPNAEFFDHVRLMLQLIGVNLGLPLCLVLMDGSETNFSGWRGAVDEARKGFKSNQMNLIKRLHRPVYELKVRHWMDEDAALRSIAGQSGVNIFRHQWNVPTWQYIDPVGDAQGDEIRLKNNLTSPRRLHNEGGRDWETVADETVEDNKYAIVNAKRAAQEINEEFDDGQPVHWRDLVSLPMSSGVQMTMQPPDPKSLEQRDREETALRNGAMNG